MQQNDLPEEFLKRLRSIVPSAEIEKVIKTLYERKQISFRVNSLTSQKEQVRKELSKLNIPIHEISWYKDAFVLENSNDLPRLLSQELFKQGHVYIQNLSSMLPVLFLDPKPNEKVLDLAASPGSKTTQIAALMQNTGEIIANDISRPRLYKMQAVLKQFGVTNTKPSLSPGQVIWKKYPEYFDRVLLDAPCTMEGRFFIDDPDSFKDWSVKRVKDLAKRQQYLLRAAVSATKVGGAIVYATCTMSPEENEGVIDWILQKEKGVLEVEAIQVPGVQTIPPILNWNGKTYNEQVKNSFRVLPSTSMEGFFVAKLKKAKSNFTAFWEE